MFGFLILTIATCQLVTAGSIRGYGIIHRNRLYGSQHRLSDTELAERSIESGKSVANWQEYCPAPFNYQLTVNGCYYVVNDLIDWDTAVIRCRSLSSDAHLVVIDNAQEQSAVAGLLAWHTSAGLANRVTNGYFWSAAQRIDRNSLSTFVWRIQVDGSYAVKGMSYTHWGSGEPNNFVHALEACSYLNSVYANYGWGDASCVYPMGAVCEIDM